MRLKGKTAVVTGGASGFGAGIAEKFAAEGATVWIADINETAAAAFASETDMRYSVTDVGSNDSVQALVEAVCEELGHIDIFINNAGIGHLPQRLEEIDEAEFDRVLNVNAKSVYLTSRHVVPVMKQYGGGVILNIASTAGISPRPGLTWYNASKGWLITATKSMAAELAKDKIRVNALAPVAGETPLLATFMGEDTPEIREKFLATIPLGRFSTPEDLGQAACFLCSDEASMITGVALEVDGGRCI
jgi:3-oxoacyl-[acyl-carrier protein] reductase